MPAPVPYQPALTQCAGRSRDTDTPHAQHVAEQLVREVELIGVCTIRGHQQPTRQACFHEMEAGACRCQGKATHRDVEVAVQRCPQWRVALEFATERLDGDPPRLARPLHQTLQWGYIDAEYQGNSEHAFVADEIQCQAPAPGDRCKQGNKATRRKIGVTDTLAPFAQDIGEDEPDLLATRKHPLAVDAGKSSEQAVCHGWNICNSRSGRGAVAHIVRKTACAPVFADAQTPAPRSVILAAFRVLQRDPIMNKSPQAHRVSGLRTATSLAVVLILAACASTPPAPNASLADARSAIGNAEKADAGRYASAELAEAREKLAAANRAVAKQSMPLAQQLAEQSRVEADLASAKAELMKAQAINEEMKQSNQALTEEMQRKTGAQQ